MYVAIASSVPSNGVSDPVGLGHGDRVVTWPCRHLAKISSSLGGTRHNDDIYSLCRVDVENIMIHVG